MDKSPSPCPSEPAPALQEWFDASQPWKTSFLSLMRALSAHTTDAPVPGAALLPSQESHRIGQRASLVFAPSEVAAVEHDGTHIHVQLHSLGMWGPQGPMPLHMSELAYTRVESHHDRTLTDFADLFHHRALSLFYRAWAAGQSTASLDRPADERFTFYIGSLIGDDPRDSASLHPAIHARYAAASHLVREARNPEGLARALSFYFGVDVEVEEFMPNWISLDVAGRAVLGVPSPTAILGDQATLGQSIPDCQHRFRLVMGPLSLDQYLRLTPHGDDLPTLVDWVRTFVGYEFDWELKLLIKALEAPCSRARPEHRLGYSTWLGQASTDAPVIGMVFEPEHYREPKAY
ncbi:type VI secretion system baseplate subunit TssG [Achromobacter sp.]|uniref:type VI secretion system baseplate subunit TssG n=1 Tax=Achromobacter sp. TaxID=134375 RepID=UPI0028AE9C68|nr:type VI secretion system baseplate subunit TssG [Achromobacter sp.]